MELEMFRATHSYTDVANQLTKAFSGYLESDECHLDEPVERRAVFDALTDVQRLLRVLF